MDWFNIATIVVGLVTVAVNATMIFWFGPVRAARLTRDLQREAAVKDRKMELFRRLTATRGVRLNPDHVWALNLIPIEFNGVPAVVASWRTYLEHLNFPEPHDPAHKSAFFHERDKRLMALIEAIASNVGITFDRMDIQTYSYAPQGWSDDDHDARVIRKMALDLLRGLRPLHIAPMPVAGPFPPAPNATPAPQVSALNESRGP